MSARHILFVETEGGTLQTLMRGLAGSHDDWHIVRIAELDAAVEMLSQRAFCVVLASCGAKHADCEHFLHQVQSRTPAVMRFAVLPDTAGAHGSIELPSACQWLPGALPAQRDRYRYQPWDRSLATVSGKRAAYQPARGSR